MTGTINPRRRPLLNKTAQVACKFLACILGGNRSAQGAHPHFANWSTASPNATPEGTRVWQQDRTAFLRQKVGLPSHAPWMTHVSRMQEQPQSYMEDLPDACGTGWSKKNVGKNPRAVPESTAARLCQPPPERPKSEVMSCNVPVQLVPETPASRAGRCCL